MLVSTAEDSPSSEVKRDGEMTEAQHVAGLPPPPQPLTVAVAINGKKKSKYAVKWALEKFIPEGKVVFKLLHVRPKITKVPTPIVGNSIPISQVREDIAAAYIKETEWQTSQKILPFQNICIRQKVQADIMIIESDNVAEAIAQVVSDHNINKLVIGDSSSGIFSRKLKLSSKISVCSPSFCTIFAVSKGKLQSIRPSDSETNGNFRDDSSSVSSTATTSGLTSNSQTDISVASYSNLQSLSLSLPMQRFQALSTINRGVIHSNITSGETNHSRCQSLDTEEKRNSVSSCHSGSEYEVQMSQSSSSTSLPTDYPLSDQASKSYAPTDCSASDSQENINLELEKLRIELRHARGIYAVAQSEAIEASRKLNDLNKQRLDGMIKLKEINYREEKVRELANLEKERCEVVIKEAEYMRLQAEREASHRVEAEIKAMRDAREREKLEEALVGPAPQYQMFAWDEIVSATSSFSEELKIGMGAYGTVYKCSLHHTTAAVKVLHSKDNHNAKQFQQEIEILSKVRHPHFLILLGACPERGCLVYEYMENGSLEDRLFRVNNTPSIPWFERFRIAWEVASALVYLHNYKPKPIIHRDLKPANILLDGNFLSKIGDVGLSTVLQLDASSVSTLNKDTGPVGTLSYMDPEYQRTGLISAKSDVYAFGLVILQLLTAKPAMALTHTVESAIDDGCLVEILDSTAGSWPLQETEELAKLGLSCSELRRKDRPDLKEHVLPLLGRLKKVADTVRDSVSNPQPNPPYHFICPILKEVMKDPCVAADGYTYDRKAIEQWLEENDKSPMTNLLLPNRNLLPNYTLLSAIMEWTSKSNQEQLSCLSGRT
ncbi:hypothetical protein K2173_027505 [Erythroxylum novogranatense]|uniref:RING-type E3 ubiquitin transferase n=1 Tax=Erythroxylum novogranatense TaxID=1862640 RepID=A0AAV8U1V8_9ROSI|nr:hypothetical protein K2173_027505 [Erythroxylum novogranatense]